MQQIECARNVLIERMKHFAKTTVEVNQQYEAGVTARYILSFYDKMMESEHEWDSCDFWADHFFKKYVSDITEQ